MDHVFRKFSYLPFFGPLDYASHLRVYAASLNAPLSSILIPPTRPYGFHGWLLCFFEGCEWELYGMTNVALPRAGAADLRYMVLILVTTKWSFCQPHRAQGLRALLRSEFFSFFIIDSLTDMIFLCGQRMYAMPFRPKCISHINRTI